MDYHEKLNLALNSSTSPEVLTTLSTEHNWNIKWRIACNISTPPEILTILSTDQDVSIRIDVAGNVSTPSEVLTILSTDQNTSIRRLAKETQEKQLVMKNKKIKIYCMKCLMSFYGCL